MDEIFLLIVVLIGIHAYTFARWLGQNDNKLGAVGVCFLVIISLALPVYRLINKG